MMSRLGLAGLGGSGLEAIQARGRRDVERRSRKSWQRWAGHGCTGSFWRYRVSCFAGSVGA